MLIILLVAFCTILEIVGEECSESSYLVHAVILYTPFILYCVYVTVICIQCHVMCTSCVVMHEYICVDVLLSHGFLSSHDLLFWETL